MGAAFFVVRILKNVSEGKFRVHTTPDLGIPKPHVWQFRERVLYRNIKTMNHPAIQAMQVKGKYDMEEAIRELPDQRQISKWWLEKAIRYVREESGVRTVMMYQHSPGASNLTASQKAALWAQCLSKLKHLEHLRDFF